MSKKRSLIAFLLVALLLVTACSTNTTETSDQTADANNEEVITLNFGHGGSEQTAQQVGALAFKESLEEATNGRVVVNVYPNNAIGNDRELCESVQAGTLEMCLANSVQVNFVPDATVYDTYFNFETIDQAIDKFRNDDNFISTISESYVDANYHLAGFSVHGFRVVTANKPITQPSDLEGLVFRTQENEYHMVGWESIGASATPFAFNELYTALQQGTVEAQENPVELIYSQKFYEQQDYVINTNHQQQVQTWLINNELYESFDPEIKQAFDEAIEVGCDAAQTYALDMESEWVQEIKDYGVEFIDLTTEQYNEFKSLVGPQWDAIQEDVSEAVWNAYMGQ